MNKIQKNKSSKNYFKMDDEIDTNEQINYNYMNNENDFINNNSHHNLYKNNPFSNESNQQFNNNINLNKKDNNIFYNNNEKNNENIFGLNFHQDEDDENEVINSHHFSKFLQNKNNSNDMDMDIDQKKIENFMNDNSIMKNNKITNRNIIINNINNYEQKIKNNRNLISNNLKNSAVMEDEPFQISVSKYTESNNQSIFSNSRMSKNYMIKNNENKSNNINRFSMGNNNENDELDFYTKEYKINENNQINSNYNGNNTNNNNDIKKKSKTNNNNKNKNIINRQIEEQNILKKNLLKNDNNNIHNSYHNIQNNNKINFQKKNPYVIEYKSPYPNKNLSANKNFVNYNTTNNNYYKKIDKNNTHTHNNNNLNHKNSQNIYNTTEMNSTIYSNITHNTNNLNHQNKYKNNFSNRTANINRNIIPKFNSLDNTIIKEENFKKLYSKRQKAELDMIRGCYMFDKKYFNFDIKSGSNTINYIKFIKPSEPIIQINYRNVNKFYPLIRKKFLNEVSYDTNTNNNINKSFNTINNKNGNIRKFQSFNERNNSKMSKNFCSSYENIEYNFNNDIQPIKKKNKIPLPKNKLQQYDISEQNNDFNNNKNINNNYLDIENINNSNNYNNNKINKDGLSIHFKQKIYDWLVDIDIIKDKIIKVDSLPTLCINGVLLCDLINRCEGKNETIKGIIRKTSTRSQIQVNINKVLDYLRSLQKFPSRHLWNNLEISKGNSLIIWELLDDIYNFYGNKVTFKRMSKKNNIKKSLNKTFTRDIKNHKNKDIDKNDDKYDNLEINKKNSKTPLKQRNMFMYSLDENKNNDNKNIGNKEDSFYNNNLNYSKYSYTPIENNKISNNLKKKKNMKNNFINNNNFYFNNNNNFNSHQINKNNTSERTFNIYDNYKKINKKEKKQNNNNRFNNFDFNFRPTESNNRNNLNHTDDNFYESKMFSFDNDNVNIKENKTKKNKKNKNNNDDNNNTYRKNFDVSSIYSDRFFNVEKSNKSFSVNNGFYSKKRKNKNNLYSGNNSRYNLKNSNQSFYSAIPDNKMRNRGCFLLFEKSSVNKLREKIGAFSKYNTNDLETLDIKDI